MKRKHRPRITQDEITSIRNLAEKGYSIAHIATHVGRSKPTIGRYFPLMDAPRSAIVEPPAPSQVVIPPAAWVSDKIKITISVDGCTTNDLMAAFLKVIAAR